MTKAALLTIHLATAFSFVPMRGKGLKIACAEHEVFKVRALLMLRLALPGVLSAGRLDDLEVLLFPRPRPAWPGLVALCFASLDRALAATTGTD